MIFHKVVERSVMNKCIENTTGNRNYNSVLGCQFELGIPADDFQIKDHFSALIWFKVFKF